MVNNLDEMIDDIPKHFEPWLLMPWDQFRHAVENVQSSHRASSWLQHGWAVCLAGFGDVHPEEIRSLLGREFDPSVRCLLPGMDEPMQMDSMVAARRLEASHPAPWILILPPAAPRGFQGWDKGKASALPAYEVMERLLEPDGCPWDLEQDHLSLRPYVIEEAYEVVDAINVGNMDKLADELGDLLLQVIFHSLLAEKEGHFAWEDVVEHLRAKLVRRHPHVFARDTFEAGQEAKSWEAIKRQERGEQQEESALDGLTTGLPALLYAQKLQARASKVGFDWADAAEAWPKVREELLEIEAAADDKEREEEWGDLLFALVNVIRLYGYDAETLLRQGSAKFERRFRQMERLARARGETLENLPLEAQESLWQQSKLDES